MTDSNEENEEEVLVNLHLSAEHVATLRQALGIEEVQARIDRLVADREEVQALIQTYRDCVRAHEERDAVAMVYVARLRKWLKSGGEGDCLDSLGRLLDILDPESADPEAP